MIWRSFIDVSRDTVHVMPDNPHHEYVDCWCHPTEEIMGGDGVNMVLVSHREDGE